MNKIEKEKATGSGCEEIIRNFFKNEDKMWRPKDKTQPRVQAYELWILRE